MINPLNFNPLNFNPLTFNLLSIPFNLHWSTRELKDNFNPHLPANNPQHYPLKVLNSKKGNNLHNFY